MPYSLMEQTDKELDGEVGLLVVARLGLLDDGHHPLHLVVPLQHGHHAGLLPGVLHQREVHQLVRQLPHLNGLTGSQLGERRASSACYIAVLLLSPHFSSGLPLPNHFILPSQLSVPSPSSSLS